MVIYSIGMYCKIMTLLYYAIKGRIDLIWVGSLQIWPLSLYSLLCFPLDSDPRWVGRAGCAVHPSGEWSAIKPKLAYEDILFFCTGKIHY